MIGVHQRAQASHVAACSSCDSGKTRQSMKHLLQAIRRRSGGRRDLRQSLVAFPERHDLAASCMVVAVSKQRHYSGKTEVQSGACCADVLARSG